MKLIIQIPCFNEAESLPQMLADLPRCIPGFDTVEVLVIDDGCTDGTVKIAHESGVDHIVRLCGHQGLARAFLAGLLASAELGADVIVNTDADNQYNAEDIPVLVQPVLDDKADVVVGARPIADIHHFSIGKKLLHRVGSFVIRRLANVDVQDAPSGFRAFSRDAALRLNVFSKFTYTVETIIQASVSNLRVVTVPVRVNDPTRPSRLFRSNLGYVYRTALTVISVYLIYRPARMFSALACTSLGCGSFLGLRYLFLVQQGEGAGHIQSVILCAVFILAGLLLMAVGTLAFLLSINRRLLEEQRYLALCRRDRVTPGTWSRPTTLSPRGVGQFRPPSE